MKKVKYSPMKKKEASAFYSGRKYSKFYTEHHKYSKTNDFRWVYPRVRTISK